MPPVAQESTKGRAKLFKTLEQSRAHFIPLGSASSSADGSDEESFCPEDEEGAPSLSTTHDNSTTRGMLDGVVRVAQQWVSLI